MPATIGNGNDVVTINGVRVQFQGIAHVKKDMATEAAAQKTKNNGLDEYIIAFRNEHGQTERMIVWGDRLDFSFHKKRHAPSVEVNGQRGQIVHFENEAATFAEGAVRGASDGFRDAFETLSQTGKKVVAGLAVAGGTVVVGGTIFLVATKGAGAAAVGAAMATVGPPAAVGTAVVGGTALMVIGASGALKGGFSANNNRPQMETIAAVVEDSGHIH